MLGQWTAAYATGTAALEFVRGRAPLWLEVQLVLAAVDAARGDEARCRERCERIRRIGGEANSPSSVVLADRREALLDLGLGLTPRRAQAPAAGAEHRPCCRAAAPDPSSVPDLVELHVRAGLPGEAAALVPEFAAVVTDGSSAQRTGTPPPHPGARRGSARLSRRSSRSRSLLTSAPACPSSAHAPCCAGASGCGATSAWVAGLGAAPRGEGAVRRAGSRALVRPRGRRASPPVPRLPPRSRLPRSPAVPRRRSSRWRFSSRMGAERRRSRAP